MFIRNTWYVVDEPMEVPCGRLLARTLLDEKVVLFRTQAGRVVTFRDACPHRYAPLSAGRIEKDCIRCPYHGSLYDAEGRCLEVPGQRGTHGMSVGLTCFPIIERYNYLWIWMGDPKRAGDESAIPEWNDNVDWDLALRYATPGYFSKDDSHSDSPRASHLRNLMPRLNGAEGGSAAGSNPASRLKCTPLCT